jgi:molybdenum cofactor biosynthesis enzyme MoaA
MIKSIELNLTELCNLTCGFCPRGSEYNPYPNQNLHMSLDTVKLIAEQAAQFDKNIKFILSGRGEPTLHPEFDKIIDIIKNYNFKIQIYTNGYRLNKFKSSIEKCNWILYDVYSEKEEDFILAIEELSNINIPNKKVQFKSSKGHIKHTWKNGKYLLNTSKYFLNNRAGAIDKKYDIKPNQTKYCKFIEERLFIDWNGNYNLCCNDWSTKSLNNIHRQNIKTYVEQNEYLQAYKNGIKLGKRLSPCDVCTI